MRKREMSYKDYGMTRDEVKYVSDFCKKAGEKEKAYIKAALSALSVYCASYVFLSLTLNISYEQMDRERGIYINKGDFYAYRRMGVAAIKRWMILYGIWEM